MAISMVDTKRKASYGCLVWLEKAQIARFVQKSVIFELF